MIGTVAAFSLAVLPASRPTDHEIRRPVAAVLSKSETELLIANQDGQLVTHNLSTSAVSSVTVGRQLTDLWTLASGEILATDTAAPELLRIDPASGRVTDRLRVSRWPSRIAVKGSTCAVTSCWGHAVTIVDCAGKLRIVKTIPLPFPPREVLALSNGRFVVADAFAGEIAVLSPETDGAESGAEWSVRRHQLYGHNIGGLAEFGGRVFFSHQILNELSRSDFADVHWGTLMQNTVSHVSLESLEHERLVPKRIALGDIGNGAADPAGMQLLTDQRLAVALSGTDEILVVSDPLKSGRYAIAKGPRFKTGSRPIRLTANRDGSRMFSVNHLGDSVTMIETDNAPVMIGGRADELNAVQRGERAFFSARLSHDRWLSCHSCHTQGHTPGLKADTMGDGSFGNPKLIPTLRGVAETAPWGWNGAFASIEEQITKSVRTTMHGQVENEVIADLSAYLRTLKLPPNQRVETSDGAVEAGAVLFEQHGCVRCHQPGVFTSESVWDVGFRDENKLDRFNPPSLRRLSQRRRYFHDGRADTLSTALRQHARSLNKRIPSAELDRIAAYLKTL